MPAHGGADLIEGFSATGERLFSIAFDAEPVMDLPDDRSFAFVVPTQMLQGRALARLRLASRGREIERRSRVSEGASIDGAAARATTTRLSARGRRVTWPADEVRGVLIRDAATGEFLAFGRDGSAEVQSRGAELQLLFSDGVRTVKRRVAPR